MKRWLPWVALAVVLVVALTVGAQRRSAPQSLDAHVLRVADGIKCPICQGQSAADSDSAASQAIRDEIRSRIEQGQSDSTIRAYLVSRYGRDILLKPPASGVSGLVWILPVMAFVLAIGGLALAFSRWRRSRSDGVVTEADEALVEQALRSS
jgi:cytochrome c-type biogenesis protein CcmH